jgi:hypothetical protein
MGRRNVKNLRQTPDTPAERYRHGKLFRARAGEIVTWKSPHGYCRIPRSVATGQAHHEIYEPEAAVVRRIFFDRAAGITVREICRRSTPMGCPRRPASHLGSLHGLSAAAQRSLHRPGLLQSHRIGARPASQPPQPARAAGQLTPRRAALSNALRTARSLSSSLVTHIVANSAFRDDQRDCDGPPRPINDEPTIASNTFCDPVRRPLSSVSQQG